MTDLLPEFEQQFGVITADITTKTCALLNNRELSQDGVIKLVREIKILHNDAIELLEHMELEVREAPQHQREKLRTRVQCYTVELQRLEAEFNRYKSSDTPNEEAIRNDLFSRGTDNSQSIDDDQRQRLLNNTESLERSSMRLTQSYKAAIDSEQVGTQILNDLQYQRDTLTRARGRLRDTDDDLNQSSRTLNSMLKIAIQNKFILGSILAFVAVVIIFSIYYKLS